MALNKQKSNAKKTEVTAVCLDRPASVLTTAWAIVGSMENSFECDVRQGRVLPPMFVLFRP